MGLEYKNLSNRAFRLLPSPLAILEPPLHFYSTEPHAIITLSHRCADLPLWSIWLPCLDYPYASWVALLFAFFLTYL
jgi:hypothetical protein